MRALSKFGHILVGGAVVCVVLVAVQSYASWAQAAGPDASVPVSLPATSPLITWQGRTLRGDSEAVRHSSREVLEQLEPGAVAFAWGGVQASVVVRGARSLSAWISSTLRNGHKVAKLHIYVNGTFYYSGFPFGWEVPLDVADGSKKRYTLVDGLHPDTGYEITIWFVSDPIAIGWPYLLPDFVAFHEFRIDDGSFEASRSRERRLLVVGDSMSAGNQIDPIGCNPDQSGTYATKLCRHFDANCTTLAISGKGLYKNCCDDNATMTTLWNYAMPGMPEILWDHSSFVPDAVILNLGTNDMGRNDGSAQFASLFVQKYSEFILNLTKVYGNPSLPIFCGIGPMNFTYGAFVREAVQDARSKGAVGVQPIQYATEQDGCGGHPGRVGHWQMFEISKPIIAKAMGW
eukprot:TRINITY_DN64731_c0_g1_i1.p1 TRINITY_DN64731_c0_g1~~TRINITY_DN64731_c0_g1_i1.p1  ORF type:complete len:403 (-),score=59.18 TRINITY_DN64731_c0_g1_i1:108-1316(-)